VRSQVRGVSFRGAGLLDAQLDKTHFVGCDFRDADLREGEAHETHFEDCDFRGARLDGRKLKGTKFTRCKLEGITGKPKIEGPYQVDSPELAAELQRLWGA
jgi:uncharacterized protein YjbI with pentapeptide repeats